MGSQPNVNQLISACCSFIQCMVLLTGVCVCSWDKWQKKRVGNFGNENSFHSFVPDFMEINTRVRIRDKAKELFMRYGIRSVSMDDIATQLGMSKKTLYQYFTDKNELVDAVVDEDVNGMQSECMQTCEMAQDAVDEIFLTVERIVEQMRNMNPMVVYDLEKFHIRSYQRFMEHRNKFLLKIIRNNLEWGIKDGLYRPGINIDVLSKFRLESMMIAFNIDLYPPSRYNLVEVTKEIIEHFVFGLASLKGYKLILRYQRLRNKKVKQYETITGKAK
jgi:TetR/AcrR family transcriptional regulator, cholesterol catabolism regulator